MLGHPLRPAKSRDFDAAPQKERTYGVPGSPQKGVHEPLEKFISCARFLPGAFRALGSGERPYSQRRIVVHLKN
jgi:hypothetical protein